MRDRAQGGQSDGRRSAAVVDLGEAGRNSRSLTNARVNISGGLDKDCRSREPFAGRGDIVTQDEVPKLEGNTAADLSFDIANYSVR